MRCSVSVFNGRSQSPMQRRVSSDGGLRYSERRDRNSLDGSLARYSPHHSPHPCSQTRSSVSGAVDELVFQTAVLPWPAFWSEGMHPVGPETEPPAALTHSPPWLPAFSVYQTPVSRNTQPPLFAIWHGRGVFDGDCCSCVCVLYVCVCVCMCDCPSVHPEQGLYVYKCVCECVMRGEETSSWGLMSYNEV